jgi:hypothetical protein
MYVRVYIYKYVCVYICMYVHMHVWMYVYICMHVCTYVPTYVYMHISMYVRTYVCMYACMHVCMYVYMQICTYVCMRVCMYCAPTWTGPWLHLIDFEETETWKIGTRRIEMHCTSVYVLCMHVRIYVFMYVGMYVFMYAEYMHAFDIMNSILRRLYRKMIRLKHKITSPSSEDQGPRDPRLCRQPGYEILWLWDPRTLKPTLPVLLTKCYWDYQMKADKQGT